MELTRVAARQRGSLAALPDDVLDDVLLPMLDDHKDLCGLARVSQHFKKLSVSACIHMARRRGCVVVPCRHDAALHAARSPYHTIVDRRGHGTPPPRAAVRRVALAGALGQELGGADGAAS
jgi:hypothetical protein